MKANINVSESKPADDPDSPLSFSMEGYPGSPPSAMIPLNWSPGWNSAQAVNKFQSEIAGPLRDGDPGQRLIEPENKANSFFADIPEAFSARSGQYLVIPLYHIFGSEILSALAPAVASRSPLPYLAISERDAEQSGLKEGEKAELQISGKTLTLSVKVSKTLPAGIGGFPSGLLDMPVIKLPGWATLIKSGT
jgi:NADH-quinone oxidoreductase subunit G